MKTSKANSSILCALAVVAIGAAFPGRLACQTAVAEPSHIANSSAQQWAVQVQRVDSGDIDLAYSFQLAIYENVLKELGKTKQFNQVFREGDRNADNVGNVLVLRTAVEKYTRGSETQRAVTTVSGATKLRVRTELLTRDGKVVFERTIDGDVRFFGSNLRATHNLARNIAKTIKRSPWSAPEQTSAALTSQL